MRISLYDYDYNKEQGVLKSGALFFYGNNQENKERNTYLSQIKVLTSIFGGSILCTDVSTPLA